MMQVLAARAFLRRHSIQVGDAGFGVSIPNLLGPLIPSSLRLVIVNGARNLFLPSTVNHRPAAILGT